MADVLLAGFSEHLAGELSDALLDHRVYRVETGHEALDALRASPSLLVLDDELPGEPSARELLERLRADGDDLPVLFALRRGSAAGLAGRLVDGLGVRRLLFPPLDADLLARECEAALAPAPRPLPPPAPASTGTPSAQPLLASVSALWEKFRDLTLRRVATVEDAAVALLEGSLDPELRRAAERDAHKLAGSAGTFGFAAASRSAREAEQLLEGTAPLDAAATLRLSELTVSLRRELEGRPPTPRTEADAPPAAAAGDRPILLVLSDDDEFAARVAAEGETRGLDVRTGSPAGITPVDGADPQAVVLAAAGADVLRRVAARFPGTALVTLSDDGSFAARLAAARLGARLFLRTPVSPARVADAAESLLRRADLEGRQVLAVDDDATVLAAIRIHLEPRGIAVTTLPGADGFWDALERLRPDLVMLDVDLPGVGGLDLARVVRGDPRWSAVPLLFLTARTDPDSVGQIFGTGADDYVPKPIVGPVLVSRIENRLERMRLQRQMVESDPLTGVSNRGRAEGATARLLRLAARHRQPLALARLEIDGLDAVNEHAGYGAGDELLRRMGRLLGRACREDDVVGRWGGGEFLFAMYGTDRDDGVQRVADVLERFRADEVPGAAVRATVSAGVAETPADAAELSALLRSARDALALAREAGSDRVLPAGWTPGEPDRPGGVDVVVVEDDEALAALLLHALETRGLRTQWLRDGQAAIDALTGPRPAVRGRVVLLDVDLPGRDGMGVLQALAEDGVLARSRVIMLTVRATEGEVLRALEAGAFDHVTKPFSLPVLVQRIRLALRSG